MDALEGVRVVEVHSGVAAAVAGMLLADFGADVVKVEPSGGDASRRSLGSEAWNRGKRSVVVAGDDLAEFRALLEGADVVIVSEAKDAQPYGVDLDALPDHVIVAHVTPYNGPPPWLGGHESHGLLAASLGVGRRQASFDGGPVEYVTPHLLYVHGAWAATCITAALVERERSGFGQRVTVTGAQSAAHPLSGILSIEAELPDPSSAVGPGGRHPTYGRYRAGDDQWMVVGALGPKFERGFLEAVGLTALLHGPRLANDTRNLIDLANVAWLQDEVAAALMARPRREWLEMLTGLGIPCGPVSPPTEWLATEQMRSIGMRVESLTATGRPCVMPGIPAVLTRTPGHVRSPAPAVGAHAGTVSRRMPPSPPERPRPLRTGPLAGYRVVVLGTFVATPFAGTLLAELGADVVRIEPVGGDAFRTNGFIYNRGSRSLAINLGEDAGVRALLDLVKVGDVVIDGLRPGVSTKLGIDYTALAAVKADIIEVSLSAYGEGGPLSGLRGVDMVLQGMSGMMSAQGGDDEPVTNTMPIIDVTTSILMALTSTLALFHRVRTGQGQRAWTSLASTTGFLQLGELVSVDGKTSATLGGRDYLGSDPFDRYYQTADGWIRVQSVRGPIDIADLQTHGLASGQSFSVDAESWLTEALGAVSSQDAVTVLAAAGVPATSALTMSQVVRVPELLESEFVHVRTSREGGVFVTPGRSATFSRTPRSGPMRSPGPGEHTREILAEAGLADADIARLLEKNIISIGTPIPQTLPPAYR